MFYCNECAAITGWPDMPVKSRGPCEMCDVVSVCTGWPSRGLPRLSEEQKAAMQARRDSLKAMELTGGRLLGEAGHICGPSYFWVAYGWDAGFFYRWIWG